MNIIPSWVNKNTAKYPSLVGKKLVVLQWEFAVDFHHVHLPWLFAVYICHGFLLHAFAVAFCYLSLISLFEWELFKP